MQINLTCRHVIKCKSREKGMGTMIVIGLERIQLKWSVSFAVGFTNNM